MAVYTDPWHGQSEDPWQSYRSCPRRQERKKYNDAPHQYVDDMRMDRVEKTLHEQPLLSVKLAHGAVAHFYEKEMASVAANKFMDAICGSIRSGCDGQAAAVGGNAGEGWRSKLVAKKHRKLAAVATNRSVDSFLDIVQSQVQNYPAADTEAHLQEQMCIDNEVYSRLMAMESGIRAQVAKQFKGEAWHSARQLIPQDSHTIANAAKHNYKNNRPFTNYNAADWRRLQRQRAAPEFHYANAANHDREATHFQAFFRGWSSRRRWRERRAMHEEDGRRPVTLKGFERMLRESNEQLKRSIVEHVTGYFICMYLFTPPSLSAQFLVSVLWNECAQLLFCDPSRCGSGSDHHLYVQKNMFRMFFSAYVTVGRLLQQLLDVACTGLQHESVQRKPFYGLL